MEVQPSKIHPSLAGRTVGSYQILEMIGRGGMGDVYRAWDQRLKRVVAVKTVRGGMASDSTSKRRFLREIRVAARVTHPYVATLLDAVEEEGSLYLVMEHIEGRRLDVVLREDDPGLRGVTGYSLQIAEALVAIHEAGLVHRDLKPGNVMITPAGHVKVMDFGVARQVSVPCLTPEGVETATDESTATGGAAGTVAYMSPEQLRGRPVDGRSDLFSLGVIVYEAITGEHPFVRESLLATASAILHEPPGGGTEPRTLTESGPMRQIVHSLLEKDPAQRYQKAQTVVEDLRAVSGGETLSAREWKAPRTQPSRKLLVATSVVVLLIALIGYALWRQGGGGAGAPVVPGAARPVVAVLPFEDKTGQEDGDIRGQMVADLLAAALDESGALRSLGTERVQEILLALPSGARKAQELKAIQSAAVVNWLVTGSLYREQDSYRAVVEVYRAGMAEPFRSFRVAAGGTAALVDLAQGPLRSAVLPGNSQTSLGAGAQLKSSSSEEARLLEASARRALREYRLSDAIDHLERAVKIDPSFVSAQTLLAQTLYRAGYGRRSQAAIERARRLVEGPGGAPSERMALEVKAVFANITEHLKDELEARKQLAERHPDEPEVLLAFGTALSRDAKYDEALAVVENSVAIDSGNPRAQITKAEIIAGLGRYASALESLEEAERLYRLMGSEAGVAKVTEHRGHIERARHQYESASAAYRSAAERFGKAGLRVDRAIAEKNEADIEVFVGRLSDAQALYQSALATARTSGNFRLIVDALSSIGAKLYVQGDLAGAEVNLREALNEGRKLENDDLILDPLINLASLLNHTGRVGEGRGLAGDALEIARARRDLPSEASALTLLADATYGGGQVKEAVQAYRDAIRIEESSGQMDVQLADTLDYLTQALVDLGDLDDALKENSRSVVIADRLGRPDGRAYSHLFRGELLVQLGTLTQAESELGLSERLAKEGQTPLTEVLERVRLAQAVLASVRGEWQKAAQLLEQVTQRQAPAATSDVQARALTAASEAALHLGRPDSAVRLAREALAIESAPLPLRTNAEVALGRALAASGHFQEASVQAARTLDEAERMGMLLPTAWSASVLISLPQGLRSAGDASVVERGRRALDAFMASIPDGHKPAVRFRTDLKELFDRLGLSKSVDES